MTLTRTLSNVCRAAAVLLTMALVAGGTSLATGSAAAAGEPLAVTALRTDSLVNPLGINGDDPAFTWQLRSEERATLQSAYRVIVSSTRAGAEAGTGDVWDSSWVDSGRSVDVLYGGPALDSATAYYWRVAVRDNHGNESGWSSTASFETALLAASEWQADWIGEDTEAALNQWKDYSVEVSASSISGALGIYLRGNATASNAYMWQISASGSTASIRPHIKTNNNYSVAGSTVIDPTFLAGPITGTVPNLFRFDVVGDTVKTYVNDNLVETRTVTNFARGYMGFRSSQGESGTAHSVKVTTIGGTPKVLIDTQFPLGDATFMGGSQTVAGSRVYAVKDGLLNGLEAEPIFRSEFTAEQGIRSARLYASALGVYEFRLNGQRVGDLELAPGWTDYNTRVAFQTYDVTDLVTSGENAIGALTGAGWYSGALGWFGPNQYGTDSRLIGQLVITYDDGSTQVVGTDGDWKTTKGPIVASDLLMGETHNANLWQNGWDEAGFDDAAWSATLDAGDLATSRLEPQPEPPVRITEELTPVKLTQVNDTWVYDLGQNMVGKVRLKTAGNNGATIRLRHAEILHSSGAIAPENLRGAKATDYFTPVASGGAQVYEPRFTYHGFRYVELTGFIGTPTLATITGLVEGTDNEASSTFDTSSTMLDQLQSNIIWGQRGNFFSVPTDTPARDERLGWSGDINVFAPTAAFNMYSEEFLRKWMTDMRDAQHANGAYPEVAPQFCTNAAIHDSCGAGSTGWADAGVTVPFVVWQQYGDTGIVRENWESMVEYIDFLDTQAVNNVRPGYGKWGDWLNLSDATPGNVLGTAFYANSVNLMAQMAEAIGDEDAAAAYAAQFDQIRTAYRAAFVAADGTVTGGSQTAYAISIGMGLIPDDLVDEAGAKLAARVAAKGGHLSTGFLGTPYLLPALSQSGQQEVAYSLMMNETAPSWGYEIAMGATTMWERWDALRPDGTPSDLGMNSFNHYAFGAVGDWMYQNIGGIRSIDPGFKHSLIAPKPGGGLTHAAVSHSSVYGTVASDWTLTGGDLALEVDVPANTTATVRVPAANVSEVREGSVAATAAPGVSSVTMDSGDAVIEIGSGHYAFTVDEIAGRFGTITAGLDAIETALDAAGLTLGDRATAGALVDAARAAVAAASGAGTDVEAARAVHDALAELADLAELLDEAEADDIAAVAAVRSDLSQLSAAFLHVSIDLAVGGATVTAAGGTTASIVVDNAGAAQLESVSTSLSSPQGWVVLAEGAHHTAALPGADERTHEYSVRVPAAGPLGSSTLNGRISYSFNGSTATLATSGALAVTSPIALATTATLAIAPGASAIANVTVTNAAAHAVTGMLRSGSGTWRIASGTPVSVPANSTVTVPVTILAGETIGGGATAVPLRFSVGGTTWASLALATTVNLGLDGPAVVQYDHVDAGEAASEAAHNLTHSAGSLPGTEAGLTRRYTNRTDPNGFMQYELAVPENAPFTLSITETYDGNQTKEYNVRVNGELVHHRINARTGGGGTVTYPIAVTDTSLSASGEIVVRIENMNPLTGNYDPSIADIRATSYTDYVDLGSSGSETAHGLTAGSMSGTNTEVRTRRYAHRMDPNGFFQFQAQIVAGQPFTIHGVETFDRAQRKVYDVSVNGTVVSRRDFDRTDGGLGLAAYQVLVDDPALTASGTVTIRFQNEPSGAYYDPSLSDVWVTPVSPDTQAPSLATVVTGTTGYSGWYTSAVTVDAVASDNRRGTVNVEHRVGAGEWAGHTAAVPVAAEGTTQVALRSTDAAGNPGAVDTVSVAIDTVAPSIQYDEEAFDVAVADATSGVATVRYRTNGGAWTTYIDGFDIEGAGEYAIEVIAEDVAGNRATSSTTITIDDVTAPEVILEASAAEVGGWLPAGTTVTIAATDDVRVATVEYRRAGSDWQSYTGQFALGAGTYTISFRATDLAGNRSTIGTRQLKLDGTAPRITPHVLSNPSAKDRYDVSFTVTDAESGVEAMRFRADGGEWQTLSGPVAVIGYGRHTVDFFAVDRVGNTGITRTVQLLIQDVAALVNYSAPRATGTATVGSTLTAATGTWNTTGIDFAYQWKRNGVTIAGATAATYLVAGGDVGKALSVTVVASKSTLPAVTVTSAATAVVPKSVSVATFGLSKTTIARGGSVTLSIAVTSPGGIPTGSVAVYSGTKKVGTVALVAGVKSYTVKYKSKGTYKIKVVYLGSSVFAADTSPTSSLRVK